MPLDEFFVDVAVPKMGIDGLSLLSETFADCSIFIDTVNLNEVDFSDLSGKFTCFGTLQPPTTHLRTSLTAPLPHLSRKEPWR